MSRFIAEIISILAAAGISLVVMLNLQKRGRIKHLLRAMVGMITGSLSICLSISRLLLGSLDRTDLLVNGLMLLAGAVLFLTGIYSRKQRSDTDTE